MFKGEWEEKELDRGVYWKCLTCGHYVKEDPDDIRGKVMCEYCGTEVEIP